MNGFGWFEAVGLAVMVVWIIAYYRWVDAPLRRWVGRLFGVEIRRAGSKYWRYDAAFWKAALLMVVELTVRFAAVLLPIIGFIAARAFVR